MRGWSLAVMAGLYLAGCADSPAPVRHGKPLGPCLVTFEHPGEAWYAIIHREPSSEYASGPFIAELKVFPRGGSTTIPLIATATDSRVLVPGLDVSNPALSSCQAFEPLIAQAQ